MSPVTYDALKQEKAVQTDLQSGEEVFKITPHFRHTVYCMIINTPASLPVILQLQNSCSIEKI